MNSVMPINQPYVEAEQKCLKILVDLVKGFVVPENSSTSILHPYNYCQYISLIMVNGVCPLIRTVIFLP